MYYYFLHNDKASGYADDTYYGIDNINCLHVKFTRNGNNQLDVYIKHLQASSAYYNNWSLIGKVYKSGTSGTPVSKYSSGWQTSFGGTSVANGGSITVTHNLGTTDVNWTMYANSSASDTGASSIHGHDVFTSGRFGAFVKNLTSNTITFELAANGYSRANGSGATITESFTGDYVKVVVIG